MAGRDSALRRLELVDYAGELATAIHSEYDSVVQTL